MSEFQYVGFKAVDRPLTDRELAYAGEQSTRAKITPWLFENEYRYCDFRGDVNGLLRRGYDVHLHYANFGIRTIALRLPGGLPFPKSVWSQYLSVGELQWKKDSKSKGGILTLAPFHEADELEEIWDPDEYLDDVVEIRNRLVAGDLRILYLLWLCAADDCQSVSPDVIEPPVPAGLAECVEACGDFLEFLGHDPLVLIAASEGAPAMSKPTSQTEQVTQWVDGLSPAEAKRLLQKLLVDDTTAVKAETIATIRQSGNSSPWPTVSLGRSLEVLLGRTRKLRAEQEAEEERERAAAAKKEAILKEKKRQERMKQMVKEPKKWLRETEKLVEARGTANYETAAELLADLREAMGGDKGETIIRKHAAHLAASHPTLSRLKSSLRKRGLLS